MKLILLYLALVVLTSVSATHESVKNKRNGVQRHNKYAPTNRVEKWLNENKKNEQCKWVCEEDYAPKNASKYSDGSWSYDLQVNSKEMLHIVYNITADFLAIFNTKLNITWITDGIYIGIFNMTADALFVIDTTRNIASIFTGIGNLSLEGDTQLILYFSNLFETVLSNSLHLSINFAFKINGFLRALQKHSLEAFFRGNVDVLNAFNLHFSIYLNASLNFNGLNVFLQPIVGSGSFSLEIFNFISGSIQYGAKLTVTSITNIFIDLGEVSFKIEESIQNSLNSVIDLGHNTLEGIWHMGGSFLNIITGTIHIGGGIIHITSGSGSNHSWEVNYGNNTGNYSLGYNSTQNSLGFYNGPLEVTIVANGNIGAYILFNITTGIGILVDFNGSALIITEYAQIITDTFESNLNMDEKFSIVTNILNANLNFDLNATGAFDLNMYLSAYLNGSAIDNSLSDIADIIALNFGDLLTLARENDGLEIFNQYGISVILNAVFSYDIIGKNFGTLFNYIYSQNNGKFSGKLMKKIYASIKANISAGNAGFTTFIFGDLLNACFSGGISIGGFHLQHGTC